MTRRQCSMLWLIYWEVEYSFRLCHCFCDLLVMNHGSFMLWDLSHVSNVAVYLHVTFLTKETCSDWASMLSIEWTRTVSDEACHLTSCDVWDMLVAPLLPIPLPQSIHVQKCLDNLPFYVGLCLSCHATLVSSPIIVILIIIYHPFFCYFFFCFL